MKDYNFKMIITSFTIKILIKAYEVLHILFSPLSLVLDKFASIIKLTQLVLQNTNFVS